MRKIFNIFLSLILLAGTVGVSVSKHYCGGELQTVSVNSKSNTCSDNMPMGMDCCDDKTQLYSLDDDFQLEQISSKIEAPNFEYLFISFVIVPEILEEEHINRYYLVSHSPPDRTDIYVQVQSFLL